MSRSENDPASLRRANGAGCADTIEPQMIAYGLLPEDQVAATMYKYRLARQNQRPSRKWYCILLILTGAVPYWATANGMAMSLFRGVVIGMLLLLTMILAMRWIGLRRLRRAVIRQEEHQPGTMLCECELIIAEEGLTLRRKDSTNILSWDTIRRVDITDAHLFVVGSEVLLATVPQRAFASPTAMDQFLLTVRRRASDVFEAGKAEPLGSSPFATSTNGATVGWTSESESRRLAAVRGKHHDTLPNMVPGFGPAEHA